MAGAHSSPMVRVYLEKENCFFKKRIAFYLDKFYTYTVKFLA